VKVIQITCFKIELDFPQKPVLAQLIIAIFMCNIEVISP